MVDKTVKFLVGNIDDDGVVKYEGVVGYTAIGYITKGGVIEHTVPLVLGVTSSVTIIDFNITAHRANIVVVPIEGWKLTSAINLRGSAIDFSSGSINQNINASSLNNETGSLQYTTLIVTAENTNPQPIEVDEPTKTYSLTFQEMEEFQNALFAKASSENSGTASNNTPISILDFVIGVKRFPFKIPDEYVDVNVAISVRDTSFNASDLLYASKIQLNMGDIVVPALYNSSLDYVGVSCNLITPFDSSFIELPIEVIGKTLSISAEIDLINGYGTINIKDGETLIVSRDTTLGNEYPIFGNYQVKDYNITPLASNNNLTKSFVRVKSPLLDGNLIMSKKQGVISSVKGYVEVENISLKIPALNDELRELINILKNGVYLND